MRPINESKFEGLRLPDVEAAIAHKCAENGMSTNVRAGDIVVITTGRKARWSIGLDVEPYPELFISIHDLTNPTATAGEAAYVISRLGLEMVDELCAQTQNQDTIRAFHVQGGVV